MDDDEFNKLKILNKNSLQITQFEYDDVSFQSEAAKGSIHVMASMNNSIYADLETEPHHRVNESVNYQSNLVIDSGLGADFPN
jgi:hypothetical protein